MRGGRGSQLPSARSKIKRSVSHMLKLGLAVLLFFFYLSSQLLGQPLFCRGTARKDQLAVKKISAGDRAPSIAELRNTYAERRAELARQRIEEQAHEESWFKHALRALFGAIWFRNDPRDSFDPSTTGTPGLWNGRDSAGASGMENVMQRLQRPVGQLTRLETQWDAEQQKREAQFLGRLLQHQHKDQGSTASRKAAKQTKSRRRVHCRCQSLLPEVSGSSEANTDWCTRLNEQLAADTSSRFLGAFQVPAYSVCTVQNVCVDTKAPGGQLYFISEQGDANPPSSFTVRYPNRVNIDVSILQAGAAGAGEAQEDSAESDAARKVLAAWRHFAKSSNNNTSVRSAVFLPHNSGGHITHFLESVGTLSTALRDLSTGAIVPEVARPKSSNQVLPPVNFFLPGQDGGTQGAHHHRRHQAEDEVDRGLFGSCAQDSHQSNDGGDEEGPIDDVQPTRCFPVPNTVYSGSAPIDNSSFWGTHILRALLEFHQRQEDFNNQLSTTTTKSNNSSRRRANLTRTSRKLSLNRIPSHQQVDADGSATSADVSNDIQCHRTMVFPSTYYGIWPVGEATTSFTKAVREYVFPSSRAEDGTLGRSNLLDDERLRVRRLRESQSQSESIFSKTLVQTVRLTDALNGTTTTSSPGGKSFHPPVIRILLGHRKTKRRVVDWSNLIEAVALAAREALLAQWTLANYGKLVSEEQGTTLLRLLLQKRREILEKTEIEIHSAELGSLSFAEQATLVSQSQVFIGIHGADLTNLIFQGLSGSKVKKGKNTITRQREPGEFLARVQRPETWEKLFTNRDSSSSFLPPITSHVLELNPFLFHENRFYELAKVVGVNYVSWNCGTPECAFGGVAEGALNEKFEAFMDGLRGKITFNQSVGPSGRFVVSSQQLKELRRTALKDRHLRDLLDRSGWLETTAAEGATTSSSPNPSTTTPSATSFRWAHRGYLGANCPQCNILTRHVSDVWSGFYGILRESDIRIGSRSADSGGSVDREHSGEGVSYSLAQRQVARTVQRMIESVTIEGLS